MGCMKEDRNKDMAVIQVLKNALFREQEKIRKAEWEIIKLKMDLLNLGVELPLGE
jgi:hypothetical protein